MKNVKTVVLCLIILNSMVSCSQDFKKLSDDEVSKEKISLAKTFSDNFYAELKKGGAYQFKDDATSELKGALTPDYQKNFYKQLKDQLGDYESIEYAEAWIQKSNPEFLILRFKAKFSKSDKKSEVRVVLDKTDKVAGFFVKPWSDMLN